MSGADDVLLHYQKVINDKIVVKLITEFKPRSIVIVNDNRCAVGDVWTQLQTYKIVNK